MKVRPTVRAITSVFCFSISLWGCGGGENGGAGSITYTGLTTQAIIDSKNALDIATTAYQGGGLGNALNELGIVQNSTLNKQMSRPRTLILSESLEKVLHKIEISTMSTNIAVGIVITVSNTIAGDCGGSFSFTIRLDDQTGNFTGSFNFNSYCSDNVTISGSMNASGQINLTTKNFVHLELSSNSITVTSSNDSFTAAGDITLSFPSNAGCLGGPIGCPNTVVINLVIRDESTGKVYWAKDYRIVSLEFRDHVDISVSGAFYHPDHGYVVLSTQEPLQINTGDDHPSSGMLVFTGSGNTTAQLIALSSTTFEVKADTDGDGIYDYHTGALNWSDLKPVPDSPPSAPTGVSAMAGNSMVMIGWNEDTAVDRYNLYMASVSGVTKNNYAALPYGKRYAGITSPFVQYGLTNGKTYYFVVTAVNANGESDGSAEVSATPLPGLPLTIGLNPTSLSFTAVVGSADPPSQTVGIMSTGGENVSWTAIVSETPLSDGTISISPNMTVSPALPTLEDNIVIGVTVTTPTPCYTVTSSHSTVGNSIILNITILPPPPGIACVQVIAYQTVTEQIGKLRSGSYTVISYIGATLFDSTLFETGSFTVKEPWLSISPTSGLAPANLTVSVNSAGLFAGTFTGSITISAIGATNNPQTVPVTLTVTPILSEPGILQGKVTIGPLCPVEPCNLSPEDMAKIYDAIKIIIYTQDRTSVVREINLDHDGNYRTELNPGKYIVDINRTGRYPIGNVPQEITIEAGKTATLDIDLDTGIR